MSEIFSFDDGAGRAMAARLRVDADRLHEEASRLDARLDALGFEGPAALRLRAAMAERKLRATFIAEELRDLARLADDNCHTG